MLIKKGGDIATAEITDHTTYLARRQFLRTASTMALTAGVKGGMPGLFGSSAMAQTGEKLTGVRPSPLSTDAFVGAAHAVLQSALQRGKRCIGSHARR